MVVIYTAPGCLSCRKAKTFMKNNDIKFVEKNIFNVLLNPEEIKYLLKRSEFGTDDIISKRSKIFQEKKIDLDNMTINELCEFVVQNPSILKRPIIIDDRNMQVGYDEEEISSFLLNKIKKVAGCETYCPHYPTCGKVREDNHK